jgi:hypothetical protein
MEWTVQHLGSLGEFVAAVASSHYADLSEHRVLVTTGDGSIEKIASVLH